MGTSSALQDVNISENSETRDELTGELLDASERLNRVIENLLDTSRLSSGMLKLKLEWCDPKDLVSITLESLSKILGNLQHKCNYPGKSAALIYRFPAYGTGCIKSYP